MQIPAEFKYSLSSPEFLEAKQPRNGYRQNFSSLFLGSLEAKRPRCRYRQSFSILFLEFLKFHRMHDQSLMCACVRARACTRVRVYVCVFRLCAKYGKLLGSRAGYDFYTFPRLERLAQAGEEELREMGMGYRAKFITRESVSSCEDQVSARFQGWKHLRTQGRKNSGRWCSQPAVANTEHKRSRYHRRSQGYAFSRRGRLPLVPSQYRRMIACFKRGYAFSRMGRLPSVPSQYRSAITCSAD